MTNDPSELLNLREEANLASNRKGSWWIVSLSIFIGLIGLSFLVAVLKPVPQNDFMGLSFFVPIVIGVLTGSLFCIVFSIISFVRKEKGTLWTLFGVIPSGIILLYGLTLVTNAKVSSDRVKNDNVLRQQYREQLRNDPEIALREKWCLSGDGVKWAVFRESFADKDVHYSLPMLQNIYDSVPPMRDHIFNSSACSSEFLSAHFQEAYERCRHISYQMLAAIVSNPNTPIELVEQVAQSTGLPCGAVDPAKYALKQRNQLNREK